MIPAVAMTYGEFAFYYMILPWMIALIGACACILVVVIGGSELRTILTGKLNGKAQFVLGWVDGGKTVLKAYEPLEPGIMARNNGKEFICYTTPQTDVKYQTKLISLEDAKKAMPDTDIEDLKKMVEAENAARVVAVKVKDAEMETVNEAAKTKASFCGRPLWLGHLSIGAAVQPELAVLLEKSKYRRKSLDKAVQQFLDVANPDTIKEFMTYNFNSGILYSILRRGIDYGKYGKPKKGFPMIIVVIVLVALGLGLLGMLIVSGKLDLSGWVKGLGLGI
jgi:hypothetical protein